MRLAILAFCHRRAWPVDPRHRGRHPTTANILNNLGQMYWAQGRYGEAEPFYKRVLARAMRAQWPAGQEPRS